MTGRLSEQGELLAHHMHVLGWFQCYANPVGNGGHADVSADPISTAHVRRV